MTGEYQSSWKKHIQLEEGFAYYPGLAWYNMLFRGGFSFDTPPPAVTSEGIKPYPPVGHLRLASRFAFFHWATGITPAMCIRLTGIGSQYLLCCLDADKKIFPRQGVVYSPASLQSAAAVL